MEQTAKQTTKQLAKPSDITQWCYLALLAFLGAATVAFGASPSTWVLLAILAISVVFLSGAVVIDIKHQIIPNGLNLAFFVCSATAVSVMSMATGDISALPRAFIASGVLFTLFWILHLVARNGLGGGDVKLAPSLGLLLGYFSWDAVLLAMSLAFLLNGLSALVVLSNKVSRKNKSQPKKSQLRKSFSHTIPFAPALASGTLLAMLLVSL